MPSPSDSGVWESVMSSTIVGSATKPRPKTVLDYCNLHTHIHTFIVLWQP